MTDLLPAPAGAPSARRTQTRQRLMTAAVTVFAERGIIGASVEEICEAAGFTRGAFYSNFSDRDELVVALLRHEMETQYAAAEKAITALKAAARTETSAEALVSTALTTFEEAGRAGRDWVLTQQELLLYAARVPEVRASYGAFADECHKQFSTLVVDAIGHAGREFSVSFADAMTLLTAAHQQVNLAALLTGERVDLRPIGVLLLAISRPSTSSGSGAT